MAGREFAVVRPVRFVRMEGAVAASRVFPCEAVPPSQFDGLRRPGVVEFGETVAALVEPVVFGAIDPVFVAGPLVADPPVFFVSLLGRVVGLRPALRRGRGGRLEADGQALPLLDGFREPFGGLGMRGLVEVFLPLERLPVGAVACEHALGPVPAPAHGVGQRAGRGSGFGGIPGRHLAELVLAGNRPQHSAAHAGRPHKPGDLGLEADNLEHEIGRAAGGGGIPGLLQPCERDTRLVPCGALP